MHDFSLSQMQQFVSLEYCLMLPFVNNTIIDLEPRMPGCGSPCKRIGVQLPNDAGR